LKKQALDGRRASEPKMPDIPAAVFPFVAKLAPHSINETCGVRDTKEPYCPFVNLSAHVTACAVLLSQWEPFVQALSKLEEILAKADKNMKERATDQAVVLQPIDFGLIRFYAKALADIPLQTMFGICAATLGAELVKQHSQWLQDLIEKAPSIGDDKPKAAEILKQWSNEASAMKRTLAEELAYTAAKQKSMGQHIRQVVSVHLSANRLTEKPHAFRRELERQVWSMAQGSGLWHEEQYEGIRST
jgi:hypothetical protein